MTDFASRRKWMVQSQLVTRGIADARVLTAMKKVPRERFVPRHLRDYAYDDMPLGIGSGQTISQPYMVGLMVQLLAVKPVDHVLEIGAGSGYGAAVIAELAGSVVTVERIPELAKQAEKNLKGLGYSSVKVITGDGSLGYLPDAPYNSIVVTAGAPEVPLPLVSYGGSAMLVLLIGFGLVQSAHVHRPR